MLAIVSYSYLYLSSNQQKLLSSNSSRDPYTEIFIAVFYSYTYSVACHTLHSWSLSPPSMKLMSNSATPSDRPGGPWGSNLNWLLPGNFGKQPQFGSQIGFQPEQLRSQWQAMSGFDELRVLKLELKRVARAGTEMPCLVFLLLFQ